MRSLLPLVWPQNTSVASFLRTIECLKQLQQGPTDAGPSSIYIYDLVSQCNTYSSTSLAVMLGYSVDQMQAMGAMGLANLIHPDDLERLSEHFQRFTTLVEGEVIEIEYRMKRFDGSWCWLRSQETPLTKSTPDDFLQVLGIIQTINAKSYNLESGNCLPVLR